MKEDFLHYVWQFQQFLREELQTVSGEKIQVLKVGEYNTNAGPDFLNAQIKLGEVLWAGSVEIHLKTSDWHRHGHQHDPKYDNVILHVVWEDDREVGRTDQSQIPTLELQARVKAEQLTAYEALVKPKPGIPCSPFFADVPEITRLSMLDRTLHERLHQKAEAVSQLVTDTKGDWETVAYQWLFRAFGFKINAEPFARLSQSLPYKIIRKHQESLFQLEALLLGQAGFLEEAVDDYATKLKSEFEYLSQKYGLKEAQMHTSDWNFLRLRPSNFPTVRLSQLAATLNGLPALKETLLGQHSPREWKTIFRKETAEYWKTHYRLGAVTRSRNPVMGQSSFENLLINAVAPLLVSYGQHKDDQAYQENAIILLESVPAERNHITAIYEELGQKLKSAADSQAVLQLNRFYCVSVNCLQCNIGIRILKDLNG